MENKQLEYSKAIEQGYENFGFKGAEYQLMRDLKLDFLSSFNDSGKPLFLFEKQHYFTPSISAETISDLIAEQVHSDAGGESGDDTDNVYDTVKELDFSQTAEMVNKALGHIHYYKLTDIEVIPDQQF